MSDVPTGFLPINGTNGIYYVHSDGTIGSLTWGKWKLLKPGYAKKRKYRVVHLRINGKTEAKTVHRIVANAFIPNPKNKPQVNHIDGNGHNNNSANLEWATASENMVHAHDHGLIKPARGERVKGCRLSAENINEIRRKLANGGTLRGVASEYGVSHGTIGCISTGHTWAHIEKEEAGLTLALT